MLRVEYGVGLTITLGQTLHRGRRKIRIRNQRENIDIQTLGIVALKIIAIFYDKRMLIAHLIDRRPAVGLQARPLQHQVVRQFRLRYFDKALHVLAAHRDVDVVVPRNEAPVAQCAEQRSPIEPIRYIVGVA